MSNNNIYNYTTPKSGNEESGFLNIKGRISRDVYILRFIFIIALYVITTAIFLSVGNILEQKNSRSFIFFETVYLYILPAFIILFNLIQGVKRMHDVNKSGWYYLFPLYNVYLTLSPGTKGNNDYGIDPSPTENIQYFDEIEINQQNVKEKVAYSVKKRGSEKSTSNKSTNAPKKKASNYILFLVIAIASVWYYTEVYEPNHRDSDYDGIADIVDDCPDDYGYNSTNGCPDQDGDGVPDKDDSCPDVFGNETDGCFYFKKVTFNNNSKNKAWLSIAYKYEDDWICKGWNYIPAKQSTTLYLPLFFKGTEVYWYADDEYGGQWTGTDRYFYVEEGGNSGFEIKNGRFEEKSGGWGVIKGFYKLKLTDENTDQDLNG